ncbi:MAG: LacI family DNA-binding transcriptional regulator [Lachnospiraceae bacterium]|nr:LacI family DNA-binding transcriptional regulator [Lachnospiraceae bacterium]
MITVKDIAKICGVSPSTVSNILNGKNKVSDETRKRVLAVVEETGYTPNYFASSMRKQKSNVISIIVEDLNQFTTPPIVVAIMAYCEAMGYRAILINLRMYDRWRDTWFDNEEMLKSFLYPALYESESIKADGIIYVAGHGRIIRCFPEDMKVPTVVAYAANENDRFPSILIDDEKGGYDIGKYLLEQGHKEIAVLAGVENNMHTGKRLAGFQKALFEAGVPYNPKNTLFGTWQRDSGYKNASCLLEKNPTAIWCMNDQMAAGVYDYLYENNYKIGEDVSVIGFDNMDYSSYLYPRITTNELPLAEIGRRSAEMMIRIIEDAGYEPEAKRIWVPCKMVIGNSVKKLN